MLLPKRRVVVVFFFIIHNLQKLCCAFWLSREMWYRKSALSSTGAGCVVLKSDEKSLKKKFSSTLSILELWSLKLSL